jgi:hypothetical protein
VCVHAYVRQQHTHTHARTKRQVCGEDCAVTPVRFAIVRHHLWPNVTTHRSASPCACPTGLRFDEGKRCCNHAHTPHFLIRNLTITVFACLVSRATSAGCLSVAGAVHGSLLPLLHMPNALCPFARQAHAHHHHHAFVERLHTILNTNAKLADKGHITRHYHSRTTHLSVTLVDSPSHHRTQYSCTKSSLSLSSARMLIS